jgi:hypothetical protein
MEEKIEQQIERNETKMIYKNHTLWLRSYERKAGGWIPRALVLLSEEEGNGEHELQGEATFALREEADEQAFLLGKQWIDQKASGGISDREISRR